MRTILFPSSLLVLAFTLFNCGGTENTPVKDFSKEVDEGSFQSSTYSNEALGWKMSFPETWVITGKASLENLDKRSKELNGEDANGLGNVKRLLAFQKNFDNNFQSTRESFSGKSAADYERIKFGIRKQLYFAYLDQRFNVDTASSIQKIDGLPFDCFEIELFDRTGAKFATQLLYTKIINGNYFSAIINFNNEKDKMKLVEAFKKSTFSKRD
jgi:hypothetical protein